MPRTARTRAGRGEKGLLIDPVDQESLQKCNTVQYSKQDNTHPWTNVKSKFSRQRGGRTEYAREMRSNKGLHETFPKATIFFFVCVCPRTSMHALEKIGTEKFSPGGVTLRVIRITLGV